MANGARARCATCKYYNSQVEVVCVCVFVCILAMGTMVREGLIVYIYICIYQ